MVDSCREGNGVPVDIRLFLFTLVISMACSFWCGVAFVPPRAAVDSVSSIPIPTIRRLASSVPSSDLSKETTIFPIEHSPFGHHVLVDINGIDREFLDSETRLIAAMTQTVEEAGLTMLSYHCHKLIPEGISCFGVLLESHVSFHTWPDEGVICLDLLISRRPNPLIPVVPLIERYFGVGEYIETKWAHELRGFRSTNEKENYHDKVGDLSHWAISPLEVQTKNIVYSNLTQYQQVDIWDVTEVRFLWNICHSLPAALALNN